MTYICLFASGVIGSLDTTRITRLACGAGVFIGCTNGFNRKSAMLKLPKRGGNGTSQGEGGGGRGEEKEEKMSAQKHCGNEKHPLISIFFPPLPLLLPPLLLSPSHLPEGLLFLFSPIFLCYNIKDGGFIVVIWTWTSFRPPKLCRHCRLWHDLTENFNTTVLNVH